tara:strand:- start:191 stop:1303 length:1113 start_codon:yes stop_codon:yes gene_type:complete
MSIKDLSQSMLDASKSVLELSEMKVAMQIVRGSESKLMPLAKKAGVRFMKPKPGDDEAHVMGDKKSIMKFMLSRGMSKDDVLDKHPELKEETIEEKKLDPVGKADADIDNDGDTDSSDEYLHKRRAAIKKAMKDEGNKFTGALAKAKEMGEKTFTCAGKTYTVDEVEPIMKGDEEGKKKIVKEKDVKETTMMSGKPEKKSIAQVRRDMQKSVKDANQKLKDAEMRKKERLKKMQKMKEHLMPIIEEFGVEMISEIIGNVRVPDAGKDSGGVRKAVGKDSSGDDKVDMKGAMNPKEKTGYNKLLQIAKKLNKAYNDEATAQSDEAEERAVDQVYKYRNELKKQSMFYKDSTVAQARKDANKAVPPKERDRG